MTTLSVERFGVSVDERGTTRVVIPFPQSLILPEPGVYSLEGDNLAGKSTIVKLVMGALPRRFKGEEPSQILIDGKRVAIRRITDAYRSGLAAVFQDDHLISTMTVREQLLMRHATPTAVDFRTWMLNLARDLGPHDLSVVAANMGIGVPAFMRKRAERYQHVLDSAQALLEEYGSPYVEQRILDKYPAQLSGGAIAVAKLLNAELTEGVRVLFLDEAFAGVQASARTKLIEIVKDRAERSTRTVVVISHEEDEILQWQPRQRFLVVNGEIREVGPRHYSRLERGVPQLGGAFPIYVHGESPDMEWLSLIKEPYWVIVDRTIRHSEPVEELLVALRQKSPTFVDNAVTMISGGEAEKTLDRYIEIVLRGADLFPQRTGTIVVIGGGAVLNVGGFVASTLHRGRAPHVLIPTTVMAMADVAVGSKTGINYISGAGPRKHVIGTYANPSAVVLDQRYLRKLPATEKRSGLAESFKHGLLHDAALLDEVSHLLTASRDPDRDACFDVALRTLRIKSRLLAADPFEERAAKTLLFGHTHAHCIETASMLSVPHGLAVYIGILVELAASESQMYDHVLKTVIDAEVLEDGVTPIERDKLRRAYEYLTSGPGVGSGKIALQVATEIGVYGPNRSPEEKLCTVDAVLAAAEKVNGDLAPGVELLTG
jgi:3-dehydroquinate synthetase/ABC-type multidrug transport system ATPase subunit